MDRSVFRKGLFARLLAAARQAGTARVLRCAVCAALTVTVAASQSLLVVERNTSSLFSVSGSMALTAENPVEIVFSPQHLSTTGLELQLEATGRTARSALEADLYAERPDGARTLVEHWSWSSDELSGKTQILHTPAEKLQFGTRYILELSSTEASEARAVRLALGTGSLGVESFSAAGQQQTAVPGLLQLYRHYSYKVLGLCLVLLAAMWAALLVPAPKKRRPLLHGLLSAGFFLLAPLAVLWCVEFLNSGNLLTLAPRAVLGNLVLCWGLGLTAFAVCGRTGPATAAAGALLLTAGGINYYVAMYRYTVMLPYDILALGTAEGVAGQYEYNFCVPVLLALLVLGVLITCAPRFDVRVRGAKRRLLSAGAALAAAAACLVLPVRFSSAFGARLNLHEQTVQSRVNGYCFNFALNVPRLFRTAPRGYNPDTLAQDLPDAVPAAASERPNIIVVMDESFCDPLDVADITTNTAVLPYLDSLSQGADPAAFVGRVAVPVYGGGTSCSEYEMLTGCSFVVDTANYAPYVTYFSSETPTMVSQLKELGYSTLALHPGAATNWHRQQAYPNMGFDRTLFLEDMDIENTIHTYARDSEGYRYVLDAIDSTDDPLFAFYVTIQNHGGYGELFDGAAIRTSGLPDDWAGEADEYLSLLHESDAELKAFFEQLKQEKEPTVVLFFGDHWSCLSESRLAELGADPASFTTEQLLAYHSTPYVMWSNCGVDFSAAPAHISANYLLPTLFETLGLPLTQWDEFLLRGRSEFPVFSYYVTVSNDTTLRSRARYTSQYARLQYNLLSDAKNRVWSIFSWRTD